MHSSVVDGAQYGARRGVGVLLGGTRQRDSGGASQVNLNEGPPDSRCEGACNACLADPGGPSEKECRRPDSRVARSSERNKPCHPEQLGLHLVAANVRLVEDGTRHVALGQRV